MDIRAVPGHKKTEAEGTASVKELLGIIYAEGHKYDVSVFVDPKPDV